MNEDRTEGVKKRIKGTIKEVVGKTVGDAKLETEGKIEKVEGKIQNIIGSVKHAVKKE